MPVIFRLYWRTLLSYTAQLSSPYSIRSRQLTQFLLPRAPFATIDSSTPLVHIWEYEGLPGFESVKTKVKESAVRTLSFAAALE